MARTYDGVWRVPIVMVVASTAFMFSSFLVCDGAGNPTSDKFRSELLELVNAKRKLHGCPPLQLDAKANLEAQKLAFNMAKENSIVRFDSPDYGANVYYNAAVKEISELDPKAVIDDWYGQTKHYDFDDMNSVAGKAALTLALEVGKRASDFMRLVWCSTKLAGIGIKTYKDPKAISRASGGVFVTMVFTPKPKLLDITELRSNVLPAVAK